MSECRDLEPLLAPYVDGLAPAGEKAAVDAHLDRCPPCRTRVECERTARAVLHEKRQALRRCAPDALHARCRACAPSNVVPITRPAWRVTRRVLPLSFAATLLLAVAAVFLLSWNGTVEALATQLAMDHVKCFQLAPDHATVDALGVGAAWQRRQGWPIRVPSSAPVEQLELLDVRRCLSTEGITAHMMYRWRGQPLSVYVLNSVLKSNPHGDEMVTKMGQEAVIWADGGRTYAVVSKGPRQDLEQVARYMRTSAR